MIPQILQLLHFIKIANSDIHSHRDNRDHASQRVMMYSYGRVVGAYAMIGNSCGSDTHLLVQRLEECYNDANGLTLHRS